MTISKIKYPRIDFTGFVNGDNDNKLAVDSSGKLKVGLSADTGVTLSSAGVIGLDLVDSTSSTATDQAPTANAVKEVMDTIKDTTISYDDADSSTYTFVIEPASNSRFTVNQTASACTYTFDVSQEGLTWCMWLTKSNGDTVAFDSSVTMDKTIDATWTSCFMVFYALKTNQIKGWVIAGE